MSKSLGNFITVRDIIEKYDPQVLRFFMLSAHYRSQLNFSADLMEAAKNSLDRILTAADRARDFAAKATGEELTDAEKAMLEESKQYRAKFEEAMDDDFNTADAIAAIFELVKFMNTNITEETSLAFDAVLIDSRIYAPFLVL
jgi:cysteinyl-tRNA synthetase